MRRFIACIAAAQHQRVIKVPAYPFLSTLGLYARNQVWDEGTQLRNICHLHAAHGFRNVVLRSRISCGWRPILTHTMSLETLKPSFLRKIKLFLAYSRVLDPLFRTSREKYAQVSRMHHTLTGIFIKIFSTSCLRSDDAMELKTTRKNTRI